MSKASTEEMPRWPNTGMSSSHLAASSGASPNSTGTVAVSRRRSAMPAPRIVHGRKRARRAHLVDAAGDVAHGDPGAGDEAADEAAAGMVVPGDEQVHRSQQHGEVDHRHRRADEVDRRARRGVGASARFLGATSDRRRGRRPARASATAPIEAATRTVISPSVSKPRKSTRMTLTTLRPSASGKDRSIISVDTGSAVAGLAGDDGEGEHGERDGDGDDDADAAGERAGAAFEAIGQLAQHEHEQHGRQRLDRGLGERQIGRTLDDEQGGHAVADGREEQHGGEAAADDGGQQRPADQDDGDRDLRRAGRPTPASPASRPRRAGRRRAARRRWPGRHRRRSPACRSGRSPSPGWRAG